MSIAIKISVLKEKIINTILLFLVFKYDFLSIAFIIFFLFKKKNKGIKSEFSMCFD